MPVLNLRFSAASTLLLVVCMAASQFSPAQNFAVLHNFSNQGDGANPSGGLMADLAGNLYGTASSGGAHDVGTAFKLTHHNSGWAFSTLYNFAVGSSGYNPSGKLVSGPDGALYGTTWAGGTGPCQGNGNSGCGTVFKITPPPTICGAVSCPWAETVLYRFAGNSDAANPNSEVTFDAAGNIFGATTFGGGINCLPNDDRGCGAIYKLTHTSGGWTETVLHSFGTGDGASPGSAVVFDAAGNMYGVAGKGALLCNSDPDGCGTIWELTPENGGWTFHVLHAFQGGNDGDNPFGRLIFDASGNLYGSTIGQGVNSDCGTIFKLVQSNGSWNFTTISPYHN